MEVCCEDGKEAWAALENLPWGAFTSWPEADFTASNAGGKKIAFRRSNVLLLR